MEFGACLITLAEAQKQTYALSSTANTSAGAEDQLKPIFKDFFERFSDGLAVTLQIQSEVTLPDEGVRPDLALYSDKLICGYIELKAPGLGADAPKLKGAHNKKQWAKLKALPNLIYTDGREFAHYRFGERLGPVLRMSDNPVDAGQSALCDEFTAKLKLMINDFILWQPHVPHEPKPLAEYLAPLTKFLREEVSFALQNEASSVSLLAIEWRQFFFPNADDIQFADAYAQTVTYAMLLAQLLGAQSLNPHDAAKTLAAGNNLLGKALELLGQADARKDLRVGFELLQRSLEALDKDKFLKGNPDLWLYFYEDFLAAYDPKLRKDYGVYYTPREVVELQVHLVSELLVTEFGKTLGFADDGVVFLDPAVGTGTYPVAAIKHALDKVEKRSGIGAVAGRAAQMARNMYGFEILVGPYSVAHLRISQALQSAGATLSERLNIFLADTLESPNAKPPGGLSLTYKALTDEHEGARKIKNSGEVLVCLGNPPYDRQTIEDGDTTTQRKGGWVRFGDQESGAASIEKQGESAILDDFIAPVRAAGEGIHLKNIYNDYVYFWRWALWRLFEQQKIGGVISFITASSYLAGPGFLGMRHQMRKSFDELWIIDLGGDNLGTRKTPNVFNIQTPVAIAVGVKSKSWSDKPAKVWYTNITGDTRDEKLARISKVEALKDIQWRACPKGWGDPFLPVGKGDFFEWPELTDIFPWSHSGVQFKRSWPIGETKEVIEARLAVLYSRPEIDRDAYFASTGAKNLKNKGTDKNGLRIRNDTLEAFENKAFPTPERYAYRPFDLHWAITDTRVCDRIRPPLKEAASIKNLFFNSLTTRTLGKGQAMTVAGHIPDLDSFRGSFGGKNIIPLYRDGEATQPNITAGLLGVLEQAYGAPVTAQDLASYIYAVLGGQSYTSRFWNALETPGPRVPITKDAALFTKTAALGRKLITLHTYGERMSDEKSAQVEAGKAKNIKGISSDPQVYPETYHYDEDAQTLCVGDGIFGPVSPELWAFEVSGLQVIHSWLGYRMKKRSGKKSSPLDDIRPERWTPKMSDEFLELLWVLEATLDMEPKLSAALDAVVAGDCFTQTDLPAPTDEERKPPKTAKAQSGNQPNLL